jgi:hypothetical protein
VGSGFSGAALVEEDYAVVGGVKMTPVVCWLLDWGFRGVGRVAHLPVTWVPPPGPPWR